MSGDPVNLQNDRIPVKCPACGTVYQLRPDTVTWRCREGRCGQVIDVAAITRVYPPADLSPVVLRAEASPASPQDDSDIAELPEETIMPRPAEGTPGAGKKERWQMPKGMKAPANAAPLIAAPLIVQPIQPTPASPTVSNAASTTALLTPDYVAKPLDAFEPPEVQTRPNMPAPAGPLESTFKTAATLTPDFVAQPMGAYDPPEVQIPVTEFEPPDVQIPLTKPVRDGIGKAQRDSGKELKPDPAATKHAARGRPILWLMTTAVLIFLCVAAAWWYLRPKVDPLAEWKAAQQIFKDRNFPNAKKAFRDFATKYPEAKEIAFTPFFIDLCDAGENIFSVTAKIDDGWTDTQAIFQKYRDQPVYKEYPSDVFFAADELAKQFLDRAEKALTEADVKLARDAHQLQGTVAASMKDSFVPERMQAIATRIETVDLKVKLELARRQATENLLLAKKNAVDFDADEVYTLDEELMQKFPVLRGDKALQTARNAAYQSEAQRVRYVSDAAAEADAPADAAPPAGEPPARPVAFLQPDPNRAADAGPPPADLMVVWGNEPPPRAGGSARSGGGPPEVELALARGVLYAFATDGKCLWAFRLGIDSHELPVFLPKNASNPDLFIAVSMLEKALLAIDPQSGRVRWRYSPGDDLPPSTNPTIVTLERENESSRPWVLLPVGNEIHVLEPGLGRRMGRYEIGFPMTSPGVYDPETKLAYFPADRKRLFALDPQVIETLPTTDTPATDEPPAAVPACPSMVFTEHPSGAVRSAPSIVGPYLILAEATELSQMKLRTFRLNKPLPPVKPVDGGPPAPIRPTGFLTPRDQPKETPMNGWSWFQPSATPDRIAVVTDAGALGVYGLNLDNENESLYALIPPALQNNNDPYRALAVYSEEHLLWVMAGGKLQLQFLDVIHQTMKPVAQANAKAAKVTGVPVHVAQLDRAGNTFFLTTMSLGGDDFAFSAVDLEGGDVRWQRHLGVNPAFDPLVLQRGVLVIDRSGRLLGLPSPERVPGSPVVQPARHNDLPPGVKAENLLRFVLPDGGFMLMAAVDASHQLHIRRFNDQAQSTEPWRRLKLEGALHGLPAVLGEVVLVPCANGQMYTLRIAGERTASSTVPFQFSQGGAAPRARVYGRDPTTAWIVDGNRLRRLTRQEEAGVVRWKEDSETTVKCSRPIVGGPQVVGDRLLLVDAGGTVYRLSVGDQDDTFLDTTQIKAKVTREPFLRNRRLFVIENDRRLHCLDPQAPAANGPVWSSSPFDGRICGEPTLLGNDRLLVTDTSGQLTALRIADGSEVWRLSLENDDVGPAAAAVLDNDNRILVPLSDGTLRELSPPREAGPQVARVNE